MNRKDPALIIEDDGDDQDLLKEVFSSLFYKNELMFFKMEIPLRFFLNGEGSNCTPFLILSDINLPKQNGFALRGKIRTDAALQVRCISYLFF